MNITPDWLSGLITRPPNDNMKSVLAGCAMFPEYVQAPHRFAHYIGQLIHESGGFRYDRELWGPTAAQKRYEGRRDLGNVRPGDGFRFRGRGPIQVTGRANYTSFRDWCRDRFPSVPDFVEAPDAVNTDPWEGLTAIWYWTERRVYALADTNDITAVTRRINGGTNGLSDRLRWTDAAMVRLLGADSTRQAQEIAGLTGKQVDGIIGPVSRDAFFRTLTGQAPLHFVP